MNKKEIEEWLYEYDILNYIINNNLTVDIIGNVYLTYRPSLTNIPIQFGTIDGHFYVYHCDLLKSLKGCPKIVKRDFDCRYSAHLSSLEHLPFIYGKLYCSNNLMDTPEYKQYKLLHHLRK